MSRPQSPSTAAKAAAVSGANIPRLRLVKPTDLTDADQLRWDELADCAPEAGPFAQPWFIRPSLHHCDPAGEALLAIIEANDGAWLGVLPVSKAWSYGRIPFPHWQAWRHPNMFSAALLIRAGAERLFWEGLIVGLERAAPARPAIRLYDLPCDAASTQAVLGLCADQDRPVKLDRKRARAMLSGDEDGKDPGPSSETRRRIASLERKLARLYGPLVFATAHDATAMRGLVGAFLALEHAGWKGRAGSALSCDAANQAFFQEVVAAGAAAQAIEIATLHAGPKLVAMSAHFTGVGGWGYGFKTAFDETASAGAPGIHLLCRLTDHFRGKGLAPFDSCSAPEQQPISKLWPTRREFIDCGVALGKAAGQSAFRMLAFCEDLARSSRGQTLRKA